MSDIKIYGYASLRTGHTKEDLKKNFKNTKLYADYISIVKIMKNQMLAIDDDEVTPDFRLIENNMRFDANKMLQIDVMTSKRSGMHYKLDCIIEQSKQINNEQISSLPEILRKRAKKTMNTVIVLNSISTLGSYEDIKKYYIIFRKEKIGVLIPDYTRESSLSEYSTVGFDFKERSQSDCNRAYDLVERLELTDIQDNRGRVAGDYTIAFRVSFWLYELFKISEKTAVAMSGFSKNGFHLKADSYEQTQYYKEELARMEEKFNISQLIKRNRPVPDNFDRLKRQYEKNNNLELACLHCKIPMIFPIDYKRLLLKEQGGKKELARCLKLYDDELINKFNDWVETGNKPTAFYKQCNIEQYLSDI
ncbi:MAG: hypothetical protein J1E98_01120 [Lachnospiraceae bacterium]|nr:hypothetical protein [Lachnospiraceae bacterium]